MQCDVSNCQIIIFNGRNLTYSRYEPALTDWSDTASFRDLYWDIAGGLHKKSPSIAQSLFLGTRHPPLTSIGENPLFQSPVGKRARRLRDSLSFRSKYHGSKFVEDAAHDFVKSSPKATKKSSLRSASRAIRIWNAVRGGIPSEHDRKSCSQADLGHAPHGVLHPVHENQNPSPTDMSGFIAKLDSKPTCAVFWPCLCKTIDLDHAGRKEPIPRPGSEKSTTTLSEEEVDRLGDGLTELERGLVLNGAILQQPQLLRRRSLMNTVLAQKISKGMYRLKIHSERRRY